MYSHVQPVWRSHQGPLYLWTHGACLCLFPFNNFYYMISWLWTLGIDDIDAWGLQIPSRPPPSSPCTHILLQWMQLLCDIPPPPPKFHHIYGDHASSRSWGYKPRQVTWDMYRLLIGSYCVSLIEFYNSNSYPLPLRNICRDIFQPQSL